MAAIAFRFAKVAVGDLEEAEHFYTSVFDLRVLRRITSGEGYQAHEELVMAPANAAESDCRLLLTRFVNRPPAVPGELVIGLDVTDMNETIAAALRAGGSIESPARDFPEHKLRVSLVRDPEGHVIELLQKL